MRSILLIAVPPLLAGAAPAPEQIGHSTATTAVRYDDLDLDSAKGQARLRDRLAFAVRTVCRPTGRLTLSEAENVNACAQRARASADLNLRIALANVQHSQDVADAGEPPAIKKR